MQKKGAEEKEILTFLRAYVKKGLPQGGKSIKIGNRFPLGGRQVPTNHRSKGLGGRRNH